MPKLFKYSLSFFFLSALFFSGAFLLENNTPGEAKAIEKFQKKLHEKEGLLELEMTDLATVAKDSSIQGIFFEKAVQYSSLFEDKGFVLLIYENDSLKFWSDNTVIPDKHALEQATQIHLQKLKRGWFEVGVLPLENSQRKIVGLLRIKNEFPYQNQYLVNNFYKDFKLSPDFNLAGPTAEAGVLVTDKYGKPFCKIIAPEIAPENTVGRVASSILYFMAFIFLIVFLKKECDLFSKSIGVFGSTFLFVATIMALRYITILLHFPESIYKLELFDPKHFADATSFWLSSLGDFLINSLLLFYLSYFIFNRIKLTGDFSKIYLPKKALFSLLILLFICLASWVINDLFKGLIHNSNIPFQINNLFKLSLYSYVGLFIIGWLFFFLFIIADRLLELLLAFKLSFLHLASIILFSFSVYTLACHLAGMADLMEIMWAFAIILIILLIKNKSGVLYPFWTVIILLSWFALYSSHLLLKHTDRKENDLLKTYAEKIAAEKDPVAEHLFAEMEHRLYSDSVFKKAFVSRPVNYDVVQKRLQQQYFGGYWEKYNIKIAMFDSVCMPLFKSSHPNTNNNSHFDILIESKGQKTLSENFYYIPNDEGKINYLARIPVFYTEDTLCKPMALYIDLESKFISEEIGFPELLLDKSVNTNAELKDYSYAKYKGDELVSQYGKYPYPLFVRMFTDEKALQEENEYVHILYRAENNSLVVLTKKASTWMDKVTTFSYLFAFFSILLLLVLALRQLTNGLPLRLPGSFKYKLQVLLVCLVLVSLVLFGAGTLYFIGKQYEEEARQNIAEKIHSVLIEVQAKLGEEEKLSPDIKEYASYILEKFSNVFFTDINLYDRNGNLLASSRAGLFKEGIVSDKMNPQAYAQVAVLGKTEFIHNESIGKLKYLSAYVPFKNDQGKVLAYLNLPYFAKQKELEQEISTFLVALVNGYVVLFALTVLIAIFFSNYLTRPLLLIQEKMSRLKLGKTNEFIEWKQKDEIGNLVNEYNRMLVELSRSADLLAKSERESAWREMAKQVAHEIKNPLTPMKLNIQHLKKVWQQNSPDKDEKIERLTHTLVEQIDALSSIANEFSSFAKMPQANKELVNIKSILNSVIDLYKDTIQISFEDRVPADDCFILADKEQMLRVFNNLIKNSIQAIPEISKGEIKIKILRKDDEIQISIRDNGSGISQEVIDKIFTPNFTTKTGGMGLGLAMVKNIIESSNGRIWFETTRGIGTTFYVALPAGQPL